MMSAKLKIYLFLSFFALQITFFPIAFAAKPIVNTPKITKQTLYPGEKMEISVTAADVGGASLIYTWNTTIGEIDGFGPTITYKAPDFVASTTFNTVTVDVSNGEETTSKSVTFNIQKRADISILLFKSESGEQNINLLLGSSDSARLFLIPKNNQIKQVNLDITYDPLVLEIIDVNPDIDGIQIGLSPNTTNIKTNQIVQYEGDPHNHILTSFDLLTSPQEEILLLTIPFKAKSTSQNSQISFAKATLFTSDDITTPLELNQQNLNISITNQSSIRDLRPSAITTDETTTEKTLTTIPTTTTTTTSITQPSQQITSLQSKTNKKDLSDTGPATNIIFILTAVTLLFILLRQLISRA